MKFDVPVWDKTNRYIGFVNDLKNFEEGGRDLINTEFGFKDLVTTLAH